MKQKRLFISVIILFAFGLLELHAQVSTTATGGNTSGSGGSVSYSVGQVVYTTNTGTGGSVAQGVQQPYEISIISGSKIVSISLTCNVYPNPTTDFILLNVESENSKDMSYQLFDLNGKRFDTKKLEGNQTTISMEQYVASTYFLKVIQNNQEVKTFKIIKN